MSTITYHWDESRPGFLETDTVAYLMFAYTDDIATGRTKNAPHGADASSCVWKWEVSAAGLKVFIVGEDTLPFVPLATTRR
ncbi:MAG: hypothetical protein Q7J31_12735 [Syntrophales bacterium]|nr:hypothetical protein [Syntrophales bacterium]